MSLLSIIRRLRHFYYDHRANRFTREHPRYAKYQIGEYTYGFPQVFDWNEGTTLRIGKYCSMAKGVRIFLGGGHRIDWVTTFPFMAFFRTSFHRLVPGSGQVPGSGGRSGAIGTDAVGATDVGSALAILSRCRVVIGNDVWIGADAMILSGVTVGDGAVIGAGSVVTKSVPPYAAVAGNPARVIKMRFSPEQIERLLQIRWWDWPREHVVAALPLLLSSQIDEFIHWAQQHGAA